MAACYIGAASGSESAVAALPSRVTLESSDVATVRGIPVVCTEIARIDDQLYCLLKQSGAPTVFYVAVANTSPAAGFMRLVVAGAFSTRRSPVRVEWVVYCGAVADVRTCTVTEFARFEPLHAELSRGAARIVVRQESVFGDAMDTGDDDRLSLGASSSSTVVRGSFA